MLADAVPKAAAQLPTLRVSLRRRAMLRCHGAKVTGIDWAPDSKHLLSASQDGFLLVWHVPSAQKVLAITLRVPWVLACAYAPSSHMVASGGLDNVCTVYDLRKRKSIVNVPPASELFGHMGYISACRFRSENELLTSSGDGTCALWNVSRSKMVSHFTGHNKDVLDLRVCPTNANLFASAGVDAVVQLWDVRTGRCEQSWTGHRSDINALDFFPDGDAIASASDDASCRLFDLRASSELARYTVPDSSPATSLNFSKSGRLLFVAHGEAKMTIFDSLRTDRVGALQGHDALVAAVQTSPDGQTVATGGWDAKILLWSS